MTTATRTFATVLSLLVCCALAVGANAPVEDGAQVLEGFENLKASRWEGKLESVSGDQAVTEGRQAARLGEESVVHIDVPSDRLVAAGWLYVDTATVDPLPHRLDLRISGGGVDHACAGYVKAGRDTLALPLSWCVGRRGGKWPEGETLRISIANRQRQGIFLDNVRLLPVAPPPEGAVLADLGPGGQFVWPGFAGADRKCEYLNWLCDEDYVRHEGRWDLPDPLAGDFVGHILRDKVAVAVDLQPPFPGGGTAWLWVTHYGDDQFQPMGYALQFRGKRVLYKELSAKQILGPEGVLEGMDGAWTPEWFDRDYAKHFAEVVRLDLAPEGNRLDLGNLQIAALVLAPRSARSEAGKYVDRIQTDLSRFRRQFILAATERPVSTITPLEDERANGAMLFAPSPDEAFTAEWRPREEDRAKAFRTLVAAGESVTIPLAVVPLRRAHSVSASLGLFRREAGKPLEFDAPRTGVQFLQRVPRVHEAAVEFVPWILTPKYDRADEREVVCLALTLAPSPNSEPAVYEGSLRLSVPGGHATVPIVIEVVRLPEPRDGVPAMGTYYYGGGIGPFYRCLTGLIYENVSREARNELDNTMRLAFVSDVFNTLEVATAGLTRDLDLVYRFLPAEYKALPRQGLTRPVLFNVDWIWGRLSGARNLRKGSERYRTLLHSVIEETAAAARTAGLPEGYFLLGAARNAGDLLTLAGRAEEIESLGVRTAIRCDLSVLAERSDAQLATDLKNIDAVLITPNAPDLRKQIGRIGGLEGEREVYLHWWRADRYVTGLYPALLGAKGAYLEGTYPYGPVYNGFRLDGSGVFAVRPDRTFAPTLAMLQLRQGRSDYSLVRRCETLLAQAKAKQVEYGDLERLLGDIRDAANASGVHYDNRSLRAREPAPSQIESWRAVLTRAAATVVERLNAPVE